MIDKEGNKIIQNCIIAELDIKEDNKNIRIINSYEQATREDILIEYNNNVNLFNLFCFELLQCIPINF